MKKSCLDLALVSNDIYRYIETLTIDQNSHYPLGRVVVKNGVKTLVRPDHYPMILKFKDIPIDRSKFKKDKDVRFNLKKDGGWDKYKAITDDCKELLAIVNDDKETIENIHRQFEKMHNKMKFKSFGKTRVSNYDGEKPRNKEMVHCDKVEEVIDDIMKQKSARLEKEIQELKDGSKSRPTR